jgi:serine/threonine-protein kinase
MTAKRLGTGDEVGARYRLEEVAGTGGMATVWRASDERLERTVAIKMLSDTLAADASAVARFAREARTHAAIHHPNLVRVYDYSVTAPQPYLVMEYIDGDTLSERLDRGGFSPLAIQTLAHELLSALACVHDHGILHRDIKPANVLLDDEQSARLTDFGLARVEDSSGITQPEEVVGTLRFLAPEVVEGQPATRQSDLFALGVLLRTVGGETKPLPKVGDLISWLTRPDQNSRPPDAHAALAQLDPTVVLERAPAAPPMTTPPSQAEHARRRASTPGRQSGRLRSRVIAVSALVAAAGGAALVVADSGGGVAPTNAPRSMSAKTRSTAATTAYTRPATVDQHLQALADAVRRAAKP